MKLSQSLVLALGFFASHVLAHDGHDGMDMDMDMSPAADPAPELPAHDPIVPPIVPSTEDMNLEMPHSGHSHGGPILEDPHLDPETREFWEKYSNYTFYTAEGGNKPVLYAHAVTAVAAFAFLYPVCMLVSFEPRGQWLYLPLQTVTSALSLLAIVLYGLYAATSPDYYPGNIYGSYGVIMFIVVVVHWISAVLRAVSGYLTQDSFDGAGYVLARMGRVSRDSGHDSGHDLSEDEENNAADDFDIEEEDPEALARIQRAPRRSGLIQKLASATWVKTLGDVLGSFSTVIFHVLNVPLLFMSAAYILIGLSVTTRMGWGRFVFALLAHFIKGAVFFMLGIFELGRFFGAFSQVGGAWNVIELGEDGKPLRSKPSRRPGATASDSPSRFAWLKFWPENASIEYWQSALILFYGSTNVFLEHLGNTDGKWNHQDVQHLSIAFMFFGGGLLGVLFESTMFRRLIAAAYGYEYKKPTTRGYSVNPLPLLVIFLTGVLMSKHVQETELSTEIHKLWGLFFCAAAMFRAFTYIMLVLRPPTDELPTRPFTEVICSFCLICGGIIFMMSNRETVRAMVYRGIDSMFALTVSVGVSLLIMAYAVIAFGIKGIAAR